MQIYACACLNCAIDLLKQIDEGGRTSASFERAGDEPAECEICGGVAHLMRCQAQ